MTLRKRGVSIYKTLIKKTSCYNGDAWLFNKVFLKTKNSILYLSLIKSDKEEWYVFSQSFFDSSIGEFRCISLYLSPSIRFVILQTSNTIKYSNKIPLFIQLHTTAALKTPFFASSFCAQHELSSKFIWKLN